MAGPFDSKGKSLNYMMDTELEEGLVSGCILGYRVKQANNPNLSHALYAMAERAHDRLSMVPRGSERDFPQNFVNRTVNCMRWCAILDANRGAPRIHLLEVWEIIGKLPLDSAVAEAKILIEGCKSLIEEDRVWQEPNSFTALSSEQKAAYWIYHLRDLDDSMYDDAGVVSAGRSSRRILNDFLLPQPAPIKINPAKELKKLGLAALPAVIAHLDDPRPTRTGPLLRYGDCCQQIFEAITHYTIFETSGFPEEYPVQVGQEKLCKQRAEKWWAEKQLAK